MLIEGKKLLRKLVNRFCFLTFRYLALESMCHLASSEFSREAVKKHLETVVNALKASDFKVLPDSLNSSNSVIFVTQFEQV